MARSISRLVLVAACVVGLAGCGSGVGTPTGRAYAICRNYDPTITTFGMDEFVRITRSAKQDGVPVGDVLALNTVTCGSDDTCYQCFNALIDLVY